MLKILILHILIIIGLPLISKELKITGLDKYKKVAFIILDINSDKFSYAGNISINKQYPPCSTFKIWNTLIGSELDLINDPKEEFYKWDGTYYYYSEWNRDLTLEEAFKYSSVPAFQGLAKKINKKNMQKWINKIGYGNKDISSGLDIFWLPNDYGNPILISSLEQIRLLQKLLQNKLPFKDRSINLLKEIMLIKESEKGVFYGKTGLGVDAENVNDYIGWFVGFIESGKKTYTFSCLIIDKNISGIDSMKLVEEILKSNELL